MMLVLYCITAEFKAYYFFKLFVYVKVLFLSSAALNKAHVLWLCLPSELQLYFVPSAWDIFRFTVNVSDLLLSWLKHHKNISSVLVSLNELNFNQIPADRWTHNIWHLNNLGRLVLNTSRHHSMYWSSFIQTLHHFPCPQFFGVDMCTC